MDTAYLAAADYVDQLAEELGDVRERFDRLLIAPGPPRPAVWAANVWRDPQRIAIASIGDGAKALRAIQRNWALYPFREHGRARLIEARLPHVSGKPLVFPAPRPKAPLGSWTLLDKHTLLAAADCSSSFKNGEVEFVEDHTAPPSRAYLKLWEALTVLDVRPEPGDVCVDLGSSPGGWTWALQLLGARVLSVDKAPLEERIAALPGVRFVRESAFAIAPESLERVDWMFCDVACYPERLLGLVRRWLARAPHCRCVCTIKFQGATDHAIAREFAAIAGSRLMHLSHNKHELTWARIGADPG